MTPHAVVDIGNTRMKWGLCAAEGVFSVLRLPSADPDAWAEQAAESSLPSPASWAVAGVQPAHRERFVGWLRKRGDRVWVLDDWRQLGLEVKLEAPQRVGIDRLLNAVAARRSVPPGMPVVIVDVGSAVTVDLLDEEGAFAGGSIFPGLGLMARALNTYTAQLPLVDVPAELPALPATSTRDAIAAGVGWAVAGGIDALVRELARRCSAKPQLLVTGGDGPALLPRLSAANDFPTRAVPFLTLEGIRLAAEAQP